MSTANPNITRPSYPTQFVARICWGALRLPPTYGPQRYNATNPFAVTIHGKDGTAGYIITNQPKSFDWRQRKAKAHPWKQADGEAFESACDKLNRIIDLCAK